MGLGFIISSPRYRRNEEKIHGKENNKTKTKPAKKIIEDGTY
jgi:hypothetical protein